MQIGGWISLTLTEPEQSTLVTVFFDLVSKQRNTESSQSMAAVLTVQ